MIRCKRLAWGSGDERVKTAPLKVELTIPVEMMTNDPALVRRVLGEMAHEAAQKQMAAQVP